MGKHIDGDAFKNLLLIILGLVVIGLSIFIMVQPSINECPVCQNITVEYIPDNWTQVCEMVEKNVEGIIYEIEPILVPIPENNTEEVKVQLTPDKIEFYKKELPSLLKQRNESCFINRVNDTRKESDKGILNYGYDQPITKHWDRNEFMVESIVALKKIGKHIGPKQTHRMIYDVEKEETIDCDTSLFFPYTYEDVFGRQESPR